MSTTYLLLFSANLAFILTNLYGWLLKWFYRPKAYGEDFRQLFPAQKSVGTLYLLQILELPYLFQIGKAAISASGPDPIFDTTLLYANTFALLSFPIQMLVMCEDYFFPSQKNPSRNHLFYILAVIAIFLLLIPSVGLVSLPIDYHPWVKGIATIIFVFYLMQTIRMALKMGHTIRLVNEAAYADTDDFPVRFASYIQWVPTIISLTMALNFYLDDPVAKAVRDTVFIGVNVWFCIATLNPWRTVFSHAEEQIIVQMNQPVDESDSMADRHPRTNDKTMNMRYEELAHRLDRILNEEQIYTTPHLLSETLCQRLGTNAAYLSEAIRRCGYQSYYDMISQLRVRHAIALIAQHPDLRLQDIADRCGFSSPSSMTKAFKAQGKPAPSTFRHNG